MSKLVAENDIKDENWLDLPGETKITEKDDVHWNSASQFVLYKEDHTLANLLRMKLHTNRNVRFAGYKHPHPTIHNIEMTVQTAPVHQTAGVSGAISNQQGGQDNAVVQSLLQQQSVPTPSDALLKALSECITDVEKFSELWEKEVCPKVDGQTGVQLD